MSRLPSKGLLRLRPFESAVLAVCLLALALLGPLRGFTTGLPIVAYAAALVLLAAPGALLVRWFARNLFPGPALLPAALALGVGLYGLAGVPTLLLHLSLDLYLAACAAVLALFLAAAAVLAPRPEPGGSWERGETTPGSRWLWAPFVLLGGALVFLTGVEVPWVDGDTWNYLAWVRDHLEAGRLAVHDPYFGEELGVSRVLINGFLLEQAALSRLSGIDPVTLALRFLSPTLAAASLLAFYALGRRLFGAGPALLAGCLYALFLLWHLDGAPPLFGVEFLGRVVQDKGVARFLFLPVALCFAAGWMEGRRLRHLLLFGFLCWAVVGVHPAGLAIVGLSAAGFGLLHVLATPRYKAAWTGAMVLGAALLSILVVPAGYVLLTGRALSSALYSADIGATDPVVLANQVFVREEWMNIFVLENGSYIMHPSLALEPAIAAAYVLGVPFLVWQMRKGEAAAQLLLGTLLAATVASYVPPAATFLGDEVVGPGQLHRLSWPISLAAFLTLGWMLWAAIRWAVGKSGLSARAVPVLVLGLILGLTAVAAPRAVPEMAEIYHHKDDPTGGPGARLDPAFRWMEENITEPAVVLAPDRENVVVPAYAAEATVVSFRGAPVLDNLEDLERVSGEEIAVPQGALDVRAFYSGASPEERREILRRHEVDYALVPAGSALAQDLERAPDLARLEVPGKRFALFEVDQTKLDRR